MIASSAVAFASLPAAEEVKEETAALEEVTKEKPDAQLMKQVIVDSW
jgi:hypothetical protein